MPVSHFLTIQRNLQSSSCTIVDFDSSRKIIFDRLRPHLARDVLRADVRGCVCAGGLSLAAALPRQCGR